MEAKDTIRALRRSTGLTQKNFSSLYGIPMRTYQAWENGEATPPEYVVKLLSRSVAEDFSAEGQKTVDNVTKP